MRNNREKQQKEFQETFKKFFKIFLPLYGLAIWGATQYFAYKVKYSSQLGGVSLRYLREILPSLPIKKIYFPFAYGFWRIRFHEEVPTLIEKIDQSLFWVGILSIGAFFLLLRKRNEVTVHGTARWASQEEIKKMDLQKKEGLVLGRDWKGNILRDNGDKHVLMAAPTRGGKGINSVTPTALDWKKSIVFNDIKGELWGLTAGYRKEVLGQKVFMFCPVDTEGVSCAYNGLDYVSVGTLHEYEDVSVISQTLIDTEGKGESDHWISSAINLLNGVILHVKYAKPNASLVDVIQFLTPTDVALVDQIADILGVPRESEVNEEGIANRNGCINSYIEEGEDDCCEDGSAYYDMLGECCFNHLKHFDNKDLFKTLHNARPTRVDKYCRLNPTVAREFMSFLKTPDKERGSILSTATQKLKIFMDPLLTPLISHSDFTIQQLMQEACSLYLVTPPKAIHRTRPLMRLIITQIVYQLTDRMIFESKAKKKPKNFLEKIQFGWERETRKWKDFLYPEKKAQKNSILLLIDEFPTLGKLDIVEKGMAYIAGYGLKCFLVSQSLKQLKKIYGNDNYIQDNCSIQIFLTPNDDDSPRMISEMFDTYTEKVMTESRRGIEWMPTRSSSYMARKLMTAGEVRTLPYEEILLMMTGQNPIHGKKLFYYLEEEYTERLLRVPETSDRNPPKILLPNGYVLVIRQEIKEMEEELQRIIQRKHWNERTHKNFDEVLANEAFWKFFEKASKTVFDESPVFVFGEKGKEKRKEKIRNEMQEMFSLEEESLLEGGKVS